MRRYRAGSGARWEAEVGYSRVVRTGPHVVVTGTTSLVAGGPPERGDAHAQATQIFRNIEAALTRVGATLDDVLRTRIFVTDIAGDWKAIGRAHASAVGHVRPATTMVEVAALIEPWMRVEIEVDAYIGAQPPRDAPDVTVVSASREDVAALLTAQGLPRPAKSEPVVFLAARAGERVVGCVGWEERGGDGLLRSLCIAPDSRGRGIGTLLVDTAMLRLASTRSLWLLTEDAEDFFARFGFEVAPRDSIADALCASRELSLEACRDATAMRRRD